MNRSFRASQGTQFITFGFVHDLGTLTFNTSHTVILSSESLVMTCRLSLNTWNLRMLGAPVEGRNKFDKILFGFMPETAVQLLQASNIFLT